MPEDTWSQLLLGLAGELAADYRITQERALEMVEAALRADTALRAAALAEPSLALLMRRRLFRDARKKLRKTLYYDLRRYQQADDLPSLARRLAVASAEERPGLVAQALASHVSTRERLPDREAFDAALAPHLGAVRRLLDVGCGLYPLMAPWLALAHLDGYWALDRESTTIAVLQAFAQAEPRLQAQVFELAQGWGLFADEPPFDLAVMLKLIPVVARQEPEQLALLAQVPARRLLLSGSRIALAKRRDIERRERQVLNHWCQEWGFRVVEEWTVGEEFLQLVERP